MPINTNFNVKQSLIKPIAIISAILLVIISVYFIISKNKNSQQQDQQQEINSSGLDKNQKVKNVEDVEEVVAKWIEANPQAIINSVANMQKKAIEEQSKNAQKNISSKKSELFNSESPSYSPKGYDVTIVEFFDYNCGYCKKANAIIAELIKSDPKVRIIYKEFPILGQSSEDISFVAIAVNLTEPSLYKKFHDSVMNSSISTKEDAIKLAKNIGVNATKLDSTLKSQKDKISSIINENRVLGGTIGVNGTPGFIIGEELIPGAVDVETFKQKVISQRKK